MPTSTISSHSDQLSLQAKSLWEDPCITVERNLEVTAQDGPPTGGSPQFGPNQGFLGPLSTSGMSGNC